MSTITISKEKYEGLLEKALRYEYLRSLLEEDIFSSPPTKNARTVIGEFQNTGKYSKRFLESLERGLQRSSYFKSSMV